MDPGKKCAITEWVKAVLPEDLSFDSLFDLRSGFHLLHLLKLLDQTPDEDLSCDVERIKFIQKYLNSIFQVDFAAAGLVDFACMSGSAERNDKTELEIAKVVFAVLLAATYENNAAHFIGAAMKLDEFIQLNIKDLLESAMFKLNSNPKAGLTPDFADVLTQCTERIAREQLSTLLNYYAVAEVKRHPQVTSLIASPCQISSPLRNLSLTNSPKTPLGEFMQSPQLAQRLLAREKELRAVSETMLRQKEQQLRKMELELKSECHLRTDLELDLEDRNAKLEEKENMIRDLQRELRDMRCLQDNVDELELLRADNKVLTNDVERFKEKLYEMEMLKSQCTSQSTEIECLSDELNKSREEVKSLDTVVTKMSNYRSKCQQLELQVDEAESRLRSLQEENGELSQLYCDTKQQLSQFQELSAQLRRELEEKNSLFNGDSSVGEPMSVIVDKRLCEVEAELHIIEQKYTDAQREIAAGTEERDELRRDNQQQTKSLQSMSAKLRDLEEDRQHLKEMIAEQQSHEADLNMKIAALEENHRQTVQTLTQEQQTMMSDHQQREADLRKTCDAALLELHAVLDQERIDAETKQKSLQLELSESKTNQESLQLELNESLTKQKSLQLKLSESKTNQESLQLELNESLTKQESLQLELSESKTNQESLQLELNESLTKQESLQLELNESLTKQESLQLELNESLTKQESLQLELNESLTKQESLQLELSELKTNQDSLQLELSEAKTNQESLQLELSEIKTNQEFLQLELSQAKTNQESLQLELSESKTNQDSLQLELSELKTNHESLHLELSESKTNQEDLQLELGESKTNQESLQLELSEIKTKKESVQLELNESMVNQESLQLELNESKTNQEYLQLEFHELKNKYESIHLELGESKTLNESLQHELCESKTNQESLQYELSESKKNQESLQHEIHTLKTKQESFQLDICETKINQETLNVKIAALEESHRQTVQTLKQEQQTMMSDHQQREADLRKTCDAALLELHAVLDQERIDAETKQKSLQLELSESKTNQESLQLQLNESLAKQESLQLELIESKTNQESLQLQLNESLTKQESLQLELIESKTNQESLQLELNESLTKQESLQLELIESKTNQESLQLELNESLTKHESLQLELNESLTKQESLQLELHESKTNQESLQLELHESKTNQESLQLELNESLTKQESLQLELHESKTNQESLQLELDESKTNQESLQLELNESLTKQESLQLELHESQTNQESLQLKCNESLTKQESLQLELCESKKNQESLQHEIHKLKTKQESLQLEICETKINQESLQHDLCESKTNQESLQLELCDLKTKHESLQNDLRESEASVELLQENFSEKEQLLSDEVTACKERLEVCQQQDTEQKKQLMSLQNDLEETTLKHEKAVGQINEQSENLKTLSLATETELKSELAKYFELLKEKEAQIDSCQKIKKDLTVTCNSLKDTAACSEQKVKEMSLELENLKKVAEERESCLQSEIIQIQASVKEQCERADQLEEMAEKTAMENGSLSERLEEKESKLKLLVTQFESEVDEMKQEIALGLERFTNKETKLAGNVKDLVKQNDAYESSVTELNVEINRLKQVSADLEATHQQQLTHMNQALDSEQLRHEQAQADWNKEKRTVEERLDEIAARENSWIERESILQKDLSDCKGKLEDLEVALMKEQQMAESKVKELEEAKQYQVSQLEQIVANEKVKFEQEKDIWSSQLSVMENQMQTLEDKLQSVQSEHAENEAELLKDLNTFHQSSVEQDTLHHDEVTALRLRAEDAEEKLLLIQEEVTTLRLRAEAAEQKLLLIQQELVEKEQTLQNKITEMKEAFQKKVEESEKYWKLQLSSMNSEFDSAMCEQKTNYEGKLATQHEQFEIRMSAMIEEQDGLLLSQKAVLEERIVELKTAADKLKVENEEKLLALKETEKQVEENCQQKFCTLEQKLGQQIDIHEEIKAAMRKDKEKAVNLENQMKERVKEFEENEKLLKEEKSRNETISAMSEQFRQKMLLLEQVVQTEETEKTVVLQQQKENEQTIHELEEKLWQQQKENERLELIEKSHLELVRTLEADKQRLEAQIGRLELLQGSHLEQLGTLSSLEAANQSLDAHNGELQAEIKAVKQQLHSEKMASEEQLDCLKSEISKLKTDYTASWENVKLSTSDSMRKYEAEIVSLRQQLAAVEEECLRETKEKEVAMATLEEKVSESVSMKDNEIKILQQEKENLEAQLSVLTLKHEQMQKKVSELWEEISRHDDKYISYVTRCQEMEHNLRQLGEREQKLKEDGEKFCSQKISLETRCREISQKYQSQLEREQKMSHNHNNQMKHASEINSKLIKQRDELGDLGRQKDKAIKELEMKLKKQQQLLTQRKEGTEKLTQALELQRNTASTYRDRAEKLEKNFNERVRGLEVELKTARQQVDEYRNQLDQAGTALLGDNSAFKQHMETHDNDSLEDESLSDSLQSSNNTTARYNFRSSTNSLNSSIMSAPVMSLFSRHASQQSLDNPSLKSKWDTSDTRRSTSVLPRTTSSMSLSSSMGGKRRQAPVSLMQGTGTLFSCEDEPPDFEWNRLSELQRRNTLCLPHMRSCYPVETQSCPSQKLDDVTTMGASGQKKQKTDVMEVEAGPTTLLLCDSRKQVRHSTVYQKPGPPTPNAHVQSVTRRSSTRLTTTPRTGSKSPKVSSNKKKPRKQTPRRALRKSPRTPPVSARDTENRSSSRKANKRESIAFSIGFSPMQSTSSRGLKRQTAFIQKQPEEKKTKLMRRYSGVERKSLRVLMPCTEVN